MSGQVAMIYLSSILTLISSIQFALGAEHGFGVVTHDTTFIPDAVLVVTQANVSQSCYGPKQTFLINGTSPGPSITLVENVTYWIRVYNDMPNENLTMHWHGLSMAATPFSDGTPAASQWPIPPSHFFDYEINVPLGMAGTYFYHSHVGFQAVSATGPLIIAEKKGTEPYAYDGEKIIFLQDVFIKDPATIEKGLMANPFVWSGEAAMLLVNGKGGGSFNGTPCSAQLSVIDVEPGKTYRLRVIGATALSLVSLSIEAHFDLSIIEADGSYTKPLDTSFLQIGSGQRYSLLLTTHKAPEKLAYFIQLETRDRPLLTRSFAVLRYKVPFGPAEPAPIFTNPAVPILTLPETDNSFLDYELAPLFDSPEFPSAADVTRQIIIKVHQHVTGPIVWYSNGLEWKETRGGEPYLISLYRNNVPELPSMERALANGGLDDVTATFPARLGEVLEVVFQNTGSDNMGGEDSHPWHAHGKHYWDIGGGRGEYNKTANDARIAAMGHQPATRDTTMLYRDEAQSAGGNGSLTGWRAWRMRVDEAGVWMVHCHIIQHMIMGMSTVFVFGNQTEVTQKLALPDVSGYLTYGGSVNGNDNQDPDVVAFNDMWTTQQ